MSKSNVLELARKLVAAIEEEDKKNKVMLKDIPVGGKFETGIGRFIVLEQKEDSTAVITEELYRKKVKYDNDSNKYFESKLSDLFEKEIYPEFEREFGIGRFCDAQASLATVDMQNKNSILHARVRPLTFDEARKYNELLVNKNLPDWYWTCTAWSTEERGWPYSVAVVSPSGNVDDGNCDGGNGVRPVCIFSFSIFESCEEDDD